MKTVLVTGSTQGIGKAIATAFVKAGYKVIVHCSGDTEKAERIRKEIGAEQAVVCDLSVMDEVKTLYQKTGAVDCLVLNASVQYKEQWQDITDETFDKQFNINVKSTLKLMQAYYPAMKEKRFGRIITIGSVNQYRQHPEWAELVNPKIEIKNGFVKVPDAPGLGIESLNDKIVEKFKKADSEEPWSDTSSWDKEWANDREWS